MVLIVTLSKVRLVWLHQTYFNFLDNTLVLIASFIGNRDNIADKTSYGKEKNNIITEVFNTYN